MINMYWKIDSTEYKKIGKKFDYETDRYPGMIEVVGDLRIEVNEKTFFSQPYFPVIEFIRTLEKWDKNNNMLYNCIEAEDNPLISFIFTNQGWKIKSPWQLFECADFFSKEELLKSIENLIASVREQLVC